MKRYKGLLNDEEMRSLSERWLAFFSEEERYFLQKLYVLSQDNIQEYELPLKRIWRRLLEIQSPPPSFQNPQKGRTGIVLSMKGEIIDGNDFFREEEGATPGSSGAQQAARDL